ncbi:MAG: hypothetical protein CSA66_04550 [Proteobacteria bacterium]|nr:MAG: hypothetical protein CSA66_04550 [Pseudomonadota bacterium]
MVAAIAVIALVMLGMAVGVMFRRAPLKGSCGGSGADCLCDAQGKPRECELRDKMIEAARRRERGHAG